MVSFRRISDVLDSPGAYAAWQAPFARSKLVPLKRHNRGDYARPLEKWREMLGGIFETVVFEPFAVKALGVDLWQMVYFKGSARR